MGLCVRGFKSCTRIVYTLALKYSLYRYIGAKVFSIFVHGPSGQPTVVALIVQAGFGLFYCSCRDDRGILLLFIAHSCYYSMAGVIVCLGIRTFQRGSYIVPEV